MRYPAFIAEMELEQNRSKLLLGVWSGYLMVLAFTALALTGQVLELVPWTYGFYVLIGIKLATNTLALLSLRSETLILESQGLNTVTDVVLMTGAIYLTGGQTSPMFPIYVILISVVALLSNLAITIITAALVLIAYSLMAVLTYSGALPQQPTPATAGVDISMSYMLTDLVFATFVLGVPTFYTSAILTKLGRKQAALEARTAELIEAGEQKSQFMANITHELRTPIHGICGLGELMESGIYGPMTEKQKQAVDSIKRSAKSQLKMVDELLLLSKAEAGRLDVELQSVDLAEQIDAVIASVSWMLGTKEMTVEGEVADDVPQLRTDRGKLNQILINLLSNAVKFTPEGGRVDVAARRDGDHVIIDVTDTGAGIPPDQLDSIFDAFRQADGTMEREYGGVGLGLSLVKRLLELLGGSIDVRSAPGSGSTFTVTLPIEASGGDVDKATAEV